MITRLLLKITDYPAGRRLLWKPVYELLAKTFRVRDWSLMNFGYAPSAEEAPLSLQHEDEVNRYSIQLYHYLAVKTDLRGLDVLEVGSGRGGGAAFIKKYHDPGKVTGLDIASYAVELANTNLGGKGLEFVQGSAEDLPFANGSFDALINVESSHTYGSVPAFLAEAKRVLRPGGVFLCTDLRTATDVASFREALYHSGMELISEEDISERVGRAIELEEPVKQARIRKHVPGWLQPLFRQFAGVKGSQAHRQLSNGGLIYLRFILRNSSR